MGFTGLTEKRLGLWHLKITISSHGVVTNSVKELIFNPPSFETDMLVREKAGLGLWDLSPMIVLEKVPKGKLEIFIESVAFEDVREKLVLLW